MSENNNQTEQELWDLLTEPVVTDSKPEPKAKAKPKAGPRFAKPEPVKDAPPAPAPAERKLDAFFFACMAGVAAVSVTATLLIGSLTGGSEKVPGPAQTNPPAVSTTGPAAILDTDALAALEQENAELREQVQLQKQQIKELQAQLLDLTGGTAQLPTSPAEPGETNPQQDEQMKAYDIFNQIKEAYADFDRAKLEELIPQMDKLLSYLGSDSLNEYYKILEYVEMPSNG